MNLLMVLLVFRHHLIPLIFDFVSGFYQELEDGSQPFYNGRQELFRNFDEHGTRLANPRTLLIDSVQIESVDALDDNFRKVAKDDSEKLRRSIIAASG